MTDKKTSASSSGVLAKYFNEINAYPLITREEEVRLAKKFRRGDAEAGQRLVTANLRFVVKVAYEHRAYGITLSDLIQEGNIGLMMAVQKFDPDRGIRLISYGVWWIRAYMQNFILKQWSLVKLGTTQAQRKLFLSLDAPMHGANGVSFLDNMESEEDSPEVRAAESELSSMRQRAVKAALDALDENERFIIERHVMNDQPMTFEEIGKHLGFSHEWVRQLEMRAKRKLKEKLLDIAALS